MPLVISIFGTHMFHHPTQIEGLVKMLKGQMEAKSKELKAHTTKYGIEPQGRPGAPVSLPLLFRLPPVSFRTVSVFQHPSAIFLYRIPFSAPVLVFR
jgi:hypothetical protein